MIGGLLAALFTAALVVLVIVRESAIAVVLPLVPAAAVAVVLVVLSLLLRRRIDVFAMVAGVLTVGLAGWLFWFDRLTVGCSDVHFDSGDVTLAGTLCLPKQTHAVPGAILVHGSGRQTRHEHLFFARYLARRGIAGLAYDKRGVGASGGETYRTEYAGYGADAAAALAVLAHHPQR